jgi:hypothetical protein
MRLGFGSGFYWTKPEFQQLQYPRVPPSDVFNPLQSRNLADVLREALLHNHHLPDSPASRELAQRLAEWAQRVENTRSFQNRDMEARAGTQGRARYLIQCLILADSLAADAYLKDVMLKVIRILFNRQFAESIAEQMAHLRVFDKTDMSRARLYIDVALMLWFRKLHTKELETGSVRYIMVDSSPQYGRDYELVLTKTIALNKLQRLLVLSHRLCTFWSTDPETLAEQVQDVET